jgi:hypothetical protein
MMHRGLHPAQCRADSRTARCGQRLDSTDGSDVPAAEVLELQQRLTALLRPDGPAQVMSAGEPCSPQQYFTDLRLVSYLAVTTWPGMRHLAPASQLARAVDMLAAHQAPDGGKLPQSPATLARPADASAAACPLLIADQLLMGDTAAVRVAVRALLPETIDRASRTGWRLTFLKTDEAATRPGSAQQSGRSCPATAGIPARDGAASQNCAPASGHSTSPSTCQRNGSAGTSAPPPRRSP